MRKSQANGKSQKKKRLNEQPDRTENRLLAQKEAIEAKLAAIKAAKSPATGLATRTAARHEDRQLRAWGSTNKGTRYHHSLVGNRPEMMPLDAHLFADLKTAVSRHVVVTAGLASRLARPTSCPPPSVASGPWFRSPTASSKTYRAFHRQLTRSSSIAVVWCPIRCSAAGAVVRGTRANKRPMVLHPEAQAAAEKLLGELNTEVKRARYE